MSLTNLEKQTIAFLVGIADNEIAFYPKAFFVKLQEMVEAKDSLHLSHYVKNAVFALACEAEQGLQKYCESQTAEQIRSALQERFARLDLHLAAAESFQADLKKRKDNNYKSFEQIQNLPEWLETHNDEFLTFHGVEPINVLHMFRSKPYKLAYEELEKVGLYTCETQRIAAFNEGIYPVEVAEVCAELSLSKKNSRAIDGLPWAVLRICLEQDKTPNQLVDEYGSSGLYNLILDSIDRNDVVGEHLLELDDGCIHDAQVDFDSGAVQIIDEHDLEASFDAYSDDIEAQEIAGANA